MCSHNEEDISNTISRILNSLLEQSVNYWELMTILLGYSSSCFLLLAKRALPKARSEVFTAVSVQVEFFCFVTSCSVVPTFRRSMLHPSSGWSDWRWRKHNTTWWKKPADLDLPYPRYFDLYVFHKGTAQWL